MSEPAAEARIPITGLPNGVVALAVTRADGSLPRDRRGRVKATLVRITANGECEPTVPGEAIDGVSARDQDWVVAKSRRYWSSISNRFGTGALDVVMGLTAAGVVDLVCTVDEDLRIAGVKHFQLTGPWEQYRRSRAVHESSTVETWRARADAAADRVRGIDSNLSEALSSTRATNGRLPAVVHAAEDLVAGISHDGPRAFSQAHFETTKDRDDVATILTDYGIDSATIAALGVLRSPYVGLGGPMTVRTSGGHLGLGSLDSLVLFQISDRGNINPSVDRHARDLAVIENLQAAEAICAGFPDVAVLWCAGQPADAALDIITKLAVDVERVLVAPDADLGGVRIANRIVGALAGHSQVTIVDVGTYAHPTREPFGSASVAGLKALADGSGPTQEFARACVDRGYPVEQEATIRSALAATLVR